MQQKSICNEHIMYSWSCAMYHAPSNKDFLHKPSSIAVCENRDILHRNSTQIAFSLSKQTPEGLKRKFSKHDSLTY